jgi:hypothetical protein
MRHPSRPSPAAYTATIRPLPLHHPSLRRVRLSARQTDALTALTVPLVIDGTSPATPCTQGELAIQDAVSDALGDREVCAVLYRWSNGGELWVMCAGTFVQVANITLVPARQQAGVAA